MSSILAFLALATRQLSFNKIVINTNEARILVIVRMFVELLKRLNAAPLFFTSVKFNKLGIIFIDLSKPNVINTKNLLT